MFHSLINNIYQTFLKFVYDGLSLEEVMHLQTTLKKFLGNSH
jgi:hypothetical protein